MTAQQQWTAFFAILHKEVYRFFRIWMQTLLPPVISITLYLMIFGDLMGSRIGQIEGYSYVDFIVPGLIMMAVMMNAYTNVSSSFFSAKFQRCIEELLVSPTPPYIVVLGYVMGGTIRGLMVACIATLAALFFTDIIVTHYFITLAIIVMTAILFSLAGFINAVFAHSFDDIAVIPTFVLAPLIYLGGVFYSVNMLPDFWATVSHLNPILYIVNAFRYGVLGVSDINVAWAFLIVGVCLVVAYIAAVYLLKYSQRLRQ